MPFIYKKDDQVTDIDPKDPSWQTWSVSEEYARRLMLGERPTSWDVLLLPSRSKLHELASGSLVWQHINQYAPIQSLALFSALVGSSTLNEVVLIQNIRDLMTAVIRQLGVEHALTSQPATYHRFNPENQEFESVTGTMADLLDEWLESAYFDFRYSDLTTDNV